MHGSSLRFEFVSAEPENFGAGVSFDGVKVAVAGNHAAAIVSGGDGDEIAKVETVWHWLVSSRLLLMRHL